MPAEWVLRGLSSVARHILVGPVVPYRCLPTACTFHLFAGHRGSRTTCRPLRSVEGKSHQSGAPVQGFLRAPAAPIPSLLLLLTLDSTLEEDVHTFAG